MPSAYPYNSSSDCAVKLENYFQIAKQNVKKNTLETKIRLKSTSNPYK